MTVAVLAGLVLAAQLSATLRAGIPDAVAVARYTPEARAAAAQSALHLTKPPRLGPSILLTPDRTYAEEGAALNIWKPSFVLGTPDGGEAGINFWGLHNDGHINVAFTPHRAVARLLDCRFLAPGPLTYKIYYNGASAPAVETQATLANHHLLVAVPVTAADKPVLVELWPAPATAVVAFFGCDLSEMD